MCVCLSGGVYSLVPGLLRPCVEPIIRYTVSFFSQILVRLWLLYQWQSRRLVLSQNEHCKRRSIVCVFPNWNEWMNKGGKQFLRRHIPVTCHQRRWLVDLVVVVVVPCSFNTGGQPYLSAVLIIQQRRSLLFLFQFVFSSSIWKYLPTISSYQCDAIGKLKKMINFCLFTCKSNELVCVVWPLRLPVYWTSGYKHTGPLTWSSLNRHYWSYYYWLVLRQMWTNSFFPFSKWYLHARNVKLVWLRGVIKIKQKHSLISSLLVGGRHVH